jgi:ankyrin repeat protein
MARRLWQNIDSAHEPTTHLFQHLSRGVSMMRIIAAAMFGLLSFRGALATEPQPNGSQREGTTPLHWAARANDVERVRALLKNGANANATNRYGVTPLSIACKNGNGAIVGMLLSAGADANARLRTSETPLMTAARTGDAPSVKALLGHGAEVNAKEKSDQTAVMWAAAEGHVEVVKLLIDAGADFKTPLASGFTPLLFAVREGRAEAVDLLLKAGVDVNEPIKPTKHAGRGPQAGMTPLLMAVENGHFELAIRLVKAGANPNEQRGGYTALHNITWVRRPTHGEGDDGTPSPAGSGKISSLEFVREIVALGANVNERIVRGPGGKNAVNWTGATPFLFAAKTADLPLLKLLLELGANPLTTNVDGDNAVIACAGLGTRQPDEVAETEDEVIATLDWLLKLGVDINAVDANGETAMHAAAYKSFPRTVQFLADHGAKVEAWNKKNRWGWTPLMIAEGFRSGCFSPSAKTIAAFHKVMLACGVMPVATVRDANLNNDNYVEKKAASK